MRINASLFVGIAFFTGYAFVAEAQKYKSVESEITFFSEAAIEDISATNKTAVSLFNMANGEVAFVVTIADFEFEKSLMKEHFNEKYLESDKYPKASFKGVITGYATSNDQPQKARASGTLNIHGVSQEVNLEGMVTVGGETVVVQSEFIVALEDYKVKIPKLLWQNIAEKVEVKVKFVYKPQ